MTRREEIKMFREKDIERLMDRTGFTEEVARRFMNSFYRLSHLEQRMLVLENDEYYYNRRRWYIEKENERILNWRKRLSEQLKESGLYVRLSGGYASIVENVNDQGGISVFTSGHYYD